MLRRIKIPPGMDHRGTDYQTSGRWRIGNLVRWVEGVMMPVLGWKRVDGTQLTGRVSAIYPVQDNAGRAFIAVGTNEKCYVYRDQAAIDVTPADFEVGDPTATLGMGYGVGPYGAEEYGTERTGGEGIEIPAGVWHFDNWGEILIGCFTADGRVWYLTPGGGMPTLEEVPGAPRENAGVIITNERHLMVIGADGDPRKVAWSARENFSEWQATAINQAGSLTLQLQGRLSTIMKIGADILVMSESDVYAINFVGKPFTYGQEKLAEGAGIIAPKAGVAMINFAVWMGDRNFYTYDGRVSPLDCAVWDWVFRDLNVLQRDLITCGHSSENSEVWWFFPVAGDDFNSRYVVWNYDANIWYCGTLGRTAFQAQGSWDQPLAADNDGYLLEHEVPFDDPNLEPRPDTFIESSPYELGEGGRVMTVTQLVPDRDDRNLDALTFRFKTRFSPRSSEVTFGPYLPDADGFTDVRFQARQTAMRVEMEGNVDWRMGVIRAEMRPGGRR